MSFRYARDHAVADWRVITFPAVPTAVSEVIVCIVNAVRFCVRHASILKSTNVFDPVIIQAKAFVVAFQKLLYVFEPPANVTADVNAHVNFIVDVPAFIAPEQFQTVPDGPINKCVADHRVIVPDAHTLTDHVVIV